MLKHSPFYVCRAQVIAEISEDSVKRALSRFLNSSGLNFLGFWEYYLLLRLCEYGIKIPKGKIKIRIAKYLSKVKIYGCILLQVILVEIMPSCLLPLG